MKYFHHESIVLVVSGAVSVFAFSFLSFCKLYSTYGRKGENLKLGARRNPETVRGASLKTVRGARCAARGTGTRNPENLRLY